MQHSITTQKAIRELFWGCYPQFKRRSGWTQNQYPADIRVSFCDFVDGLHRDGRISEALANRVTL